MQNNLNPRKCKTHIHEVGTRQIVRQKFTVAQSVKCSHTFLLKSILSPQKITEWAKLRERWFLAHEHKWLLRTWDDVKHTTQPVTAAGKPVVSLHLLQRDPNMTPTLLYWPQTNIQLSLQLFLPSLLIHLLSISTFSFSTLHWDSLHLSILLGLAPQICCWAYTQFITEHRIFCLWNQEPAQVLSTSRMCPLLSPHPSAPLLLLLFHAARRKIPLERFLLPFTSNCCWTPLRLLTGYRCSSAYVLLHPQITFRGDKSHSVATYPTLPAHPEIPSLPLKGQWPDPSQLQCLQPGLEKGIHTQEKVVHVMSQWP